MQKRSDEIRDKYIANPPEGMTADDIRHMSEDDLLDMDYFLNEDDEFGEDFPGAEGFYIFKKLIVCSSCPPLCGSFLYQEDSKGELSYKVKKCVIYLLITHFYSNIIQHCIIASLSLSPLTTIPMSADLYFYISNDKKSVLLISLLFLYLLLHILY